MSFWPYYSRVLFLFQAIIRPPLNKMLLFFSIDHFAFFFFLFLSWNSRQNADDSNLIFYKCTCNLFVSRLCLSSLKKNNIIHNVLILLRRLLCDSFRRECMFTQFLLLRPIVFYTFPFLIAITWLGSKKHNSRSMSYLKTWPV